MCAEMYFIRHVDTVLHPRNQCRIFPIRMHFIVVRTSCSASEAISRRPQLPSLRTPTEIYFNCAQMRNYFDIKFLNINAWICYIHGWKGTTDQIPSRRKITKKKFFPRATIRNLISDIFICIAEDNCVKA